MFIEEEEQGRAGPNRALPGQLLFRGIIFRWTR